MTHTSSRSGKFRTIVAAVGAAAVLVAGAGVAADAAGTAKSVLLGKNNKAKKTTKITITKKKPALALKTKGGPALSVNTSDLVKNLNADLVDGKDSTVLDPAVTEFQLGADGVTYPIGTAQQFMQTSLPAGSYEFSMHGIYGNDVTCIALDPAILSSPTPDYNRLWLYGDNSTGIVIEDQNVVTLPGTTNVVFGCIYNSASSTLAADSLEFHVRKVNSLVAGSATPTTIGPKPSEKLNRLGR
jgi:hypothetical protein